MQAGSVVFEVVSPEQLVGVVQAEAIDTKTKYAMCSDDLHCRSVVGSHSHTVAGWGSRTARSHTPTATVSQR